MLSWTWAGLQKLLFNLVWHCKSINIAVKCLKTHNKATLYETYIRNHKLTINKQFKISAGKFMHSYENNLPPSNFNQFSNRSNNSYCNYPTDVQVHKIFPTQSKPFATTMLPQSQWTQDLARNTWPYQVRSHFDFKQLYKTAYFPK